MKRARKKVVSFSLDEAAASFIRRTRGRKSMSQRANEVILEAMQRQRLAELEREAAAFYAEHGEEEREEVGAFFDLAKKSVRRD